MYFGQWIVDTKIAWVLLFRRGHVVTLIVLCIVTTDLALFGACSLPLLGPIPRGLFFLFPSSGHRARFSCFGFSLSLVLEHPSRSLFNE
jgi:hypothetical protein